MIEADDLRNTQRLALRILGHNRLFGRATGISIGNADARIAHGTAESLRRIHAITIRRTLHGSVAELTPFGIGLCDDLGHPRGGDQKGPMA